MAKRNKTRGRANRQSTIPDKRGYRDEEINKRNSREGNLELYRGRNDPSFYPMDPQILKDVASFPYGYATGSPISNFNSGTNSNTGNSYDMEASIFPGVLTLGFVPTPGISGDQASPVNTALTNFYSYVRHANSGHANYEAVDAMIYMLAMDSVYTMLAWMARLYGKVRNYSVLNRYTPDALIISEGVDPVSLRNNLANFRAFINTYSHKARALATPAVMEYFNKHIWMATNVFKDQDTDKAQYIQYSPVQLWQFSPKTSTKGGELVAVEMPFGEKSRSVNGKTNFTPWTVEDIYSVANTMLDVLLTDEDSNIISGDIMKAFKDNLRSIGLISEDYTTEIKYEPLVMDQVVNTTILNARDFYKGGYGTVYFVYNLTQNTISQSNGRIIFSPIFSETSSGITDALVINRSYLCHRNFISMWEREVTPMMTVEATRGMAMFAIDAHGNVSVDTCGSEIVTDAVITNRQGDGTLQFVPIFGNDVGIDINTPPTGTATPYALMDKFDVMPLVYIGTGAYTSDGEDDVFSYGNFGSVVGDITNWTI